MFRLLNVASSSSQRSRYEAVMCALTWSPPNCSAMRGPAGVRRKRQQADEQ